MGPTVRTVSVVHVPARRGWRWVPDFTPILGWADDVGAICVGGASIAMAVLMRRQRHKLEAAEERRQLRGA